MQPDRPLNPGQSTAIAAAALVLGAALRLAWGTDIEFKSDEQYMFLRATTAGLPEAFSWLGMPSGVYIKNPGMSAWIFVLLAKIFHITTPAGLARAVQLLNVGAIALAVFVSFRFARTFRERETWLWASLLAAVNPLALLFHRKIWAQSLLPFFVMLLFISWWRRDRRTGAFFWGLGGACLGQIHMSGFFLAAAVVLWTLIAKKTRQERRPPAWRAWLLGSMLGALPLIPWAVHLLSNRKPHPPIFKAGEIWQLKYWVFWVSEAAGLHLGNTLGVRNGNGTFEQLGDFLRYPLLGRGGDPSYLVGAAHAMLVVFCALVILLTLRAAWQNRHTPLLVAGLGKNQDATALLSGAAAIPCGILLTLSMITIRRYYLLVTFPLVYVWLAGTFISGYGARRGRMLLIALAAAQLFISANFLWYIHHNGGSTHGDYGVAYSRQKTAR